ncbi:hypothetical protein RHGRI_036732 [Rhododendron griersonianum]|uniref:Complex III subunit 9 n=1 Tax=Rhododendron griersonianum TaxID=479676 RepID=A0AAV6HTB5_9ERIC|nr:hypothetical protein RHGRI_036732 [Rhododendron griersonianum]
MGVLEGLYKLLMRRNSVYATFVIAGAFAGERAVDYGVHKIWEHNNVGFIILRLLFQHLLAAYVSDPDLLTPIMQKRYEDIPVLGQRPTE